MVLDSDLVNVLQAERRLEAAQERVRRQVMIVQRDRASEPGISRVEVVQTEMGRMLEHLGSEYGVIVNDPRLRGALVAEGGRSARSADKPRATARIRVRVAHALHVLAVRIEPRAARANEAGSRQPVFVE